MEAVRIRRAGIMEDLDGNVAAQTGVMRAVDLSHASGAQKAENAIRTDGGTDDVSGHVCLRRRVYANRLSERSFAFRASSSRVRGGALVWIESTSLRAAAVTPSTAVLKASSFAREGLFIPLSFRTNWSADARTSSTVAGGSKFASVLIFLHIESLFNRR